MRLGVIAYAVDRPLSGISRYTVKLIEALTALPNSPQIVLLLAGGLGPLAKLGLEHITLKGCERLPGLLTYGNILIRQTAVRLKLDAVHDPTGITPFLLGTGKAHSVVTIHDTIPLSFPGVSTHLDTLVYRHWLPQRLPHVDTIITVSAASKRDIVQYYRVPEAKITHIPEGTDYQPCASAHVAQAHTRYKLPERYILFVGSVEERKNLRRVLEAFHLLRQRSIPQKLVIVGAQKWRFTGILETFEKLELENDVVFTGYVEEGDLPALYTGADAFVFPSLYEGFGLPALEAMACGVPVVSSNLSSLPEVVGDAGLLIDPYDTQAIADALYRLLNDIELHKSLRAKGLARAQNFRWSTTAQLTTQLLATSVTASRDADAKFTSLL